MPILKAGGASTLDIVARVKRRRCRGILATPAQGAERHACSSTSRSSCAPRSTASSRRRVIAAALTGADDPALPRQLAQHADRRGLDPALDPGLDHRPGVAGADAQRDDPGRHGAGGRHPGRRRHRRHREHPPQPRRRRSRCVPRAILDGAQQIAVPAFVSTLCICIVFVPVVFITGAAKSLFVPLAMAVVFAMLTSYFLSRTLVPTLVQYLLRGEAARTQATARQRPRGAARARASTPPSTAASSGCARAYGALLALRARPPRPGRASASSPSSRSSLALFPLVGRDFFPSVDAGQIRLHVRCPPGTRIEETRALVRAHRGRHPRRSSRAAELEHDARQHRHPEQRHQPLAQRRRR